MNKDELFKLLENLDDDYVAEAGDKLARYYSVKNRKRIPFGATAAMAACAAVFAAVVILFKTNTIPSLPSNSGEVSLSNSDVSIDLTKEKEFEITLNAAFAYDENTGKLKRYEVGEDFGKYTSIKSAASTYLCSGSGTRLKKQEITLTSDAQVIFDNIDDPEVNITVYASLELPSFGDGFLIIYDKPDEENPNEGVITYERSDIELTVDYETKTIRFSGGILINCIEKGNIENENQ